MFVEFQLSVSYYNYSTEINFYTDYQNKSCVQNNIKHVNNLKTFFNYIFKLAVMGDFI